MVKYLRNTSKFLNRKVQDKKSTIFTSGLIWFIYLTVYQLIMGYLKSKFDTKIYTPLYDLK